MATYELVDGSCDPRLLSAGEVRVRRIPCADELMSEGDGRRADWLIENDAQRFFVRADAMALTRLSAAGATIVDAGPWGASDGLLEAVPLIGDSWFAEVQATPWSSDDRAGLDLEGVLPDGSSASVRYSLEADGTALDLEGIDAVEVSAAAGAMLVGGVLEARTEASPYGAMLLALDGTTEDLGGSVRWRGGARIRAGSRTFVYEETWPDGIDVDGELTDAPEGAWVVARNDGGDLARFPVVDGQFAGRVPADTTSLVALVPGSAEGAPTDPGAGLRLTVGIPGGVRLHVTDDFGSEIPATAWFEGESWALPDGGGLVPTGPARGRLLVSAGPAYEIVSWDDLDVVGTLDLDAILRRIGDPALLAATAVEGWPDRDVAGDAADLVRRLAARGVQYAVVVADDEIAVIPSRTDGVSGPAPDAHASDRVAVTLGSRADSSTGQPFAWPWSGDDRRPAHGAAPWARLDPLDLLATMDRGGGRFVAVDPAWVAAAGPPLDWDPVPFSLHVDSLNDLDTYVALLDAWMPLTLLGPSTWVEGVPPTAWNAVDVEASLLDGRTVASNGPRIRLRVEGAGPGELVDAPSLVGVEVRVDAPSWMQLDGAAIVGPGGEWLATWEMGEPSGTPRLLAETRLERTPWMLAICWGSISSPPLLEQAPWAATGAVWLQHP